MILLFDCLTDLFVKNLLGDVRRVVVAFKDDKRHAKDSLVIIQNKI